MENLRQIIKAILFSCCGFFFILKVSAQKDKLFVLRFTGKPYVIKGDSTEQVTRGTLLDKKSKLVLDRNDEVYFFNKKGEVTEIHETGTFKYKDLLKLKPKKSTTNLGKKMVDYLWKELTNSLNRGYNKSGVVYRGDYVELMQPYDSTMVFADELYFEWEQKPNKTRPYYFFLKEIGTENITKIGTYDNRITLLVDDVNLSYGKSYEWTVVESKYETPNNLDYSTFKVLSEAEYNIKKKELDELSAFLESIGLSSEDIKSMFCKDFRTCF